MSEERSSLKEGLLTAGGCLLYIVLGVVFLFLAGVLFSGAAKVSAIALPWAQLAALLALVVGVAVLLPLGLLKTIRPWAGKGLVAASYVIGIAIWMWSFLFVYMEWGLFWVVVGLILAGVGVVPLAVILALIGGHWSLALQLFIGAVALYGFRFAGIMYTRVETKDYDAPPSPPTFEPAPTERPWILDGDEELPLFLCYDDEAPDPASVFIDEGVSLAFIGETLSAVSEFKHAVRASPDHAGAHYNLGILYARLDWYDDAMEECEVLKKLQPSLARKLYDYIHPPTQDKSVPQ